ncbi:hypothetical protein [Nocardia amamiensis]|uniref:hypothetical protein n=1 Tax=Nocardia amamiensis TaxID=404578 RepID=UPI00147245D8|nr:hypothetical protein [Nocardia amamiensis]
MPSTTRTARPRLPAARPPIDAYRTRNYPWQLDARPDLDTAHALLPGYRDLWDAIGAALEGHYLVSWAKSIELHRLHHQ